MATRYGQSCSSERGTYVVVLPPNDQERIEGDVVPSLLSAVIPSATVLLLVGAACTVRYGVDFAPKTGAAFGVTMLVAAIATAVVGSSQDAVGLSTTLDLLVSLDLLLLMVAAYFTAVLFLEELTRPIEKLSTPIGACLAATMVVASISALVLGFRESERERAEAQVAALDSYLWALASGDLQAAYRALCPENQERETLQAFVERQRAGPLDGSEVPAEDGSS